MPKLTINNETFDVADGQRLVLAIKEHGTHIGHRCGGNAKCTTCRVEFLAGEPAEMTRAEFEKLSEKELLGSVRLSCQLVCDRDMSVRPLMTLENQGWTDTGPELEATVMPEATKYPIAELRHMYHLD